MDCVHRMNIHYLHSGAEKKEEKKRKEKKWILDAGDQLDMVQIIVSVRVFLKRMGCAVIWQHKAKVNIRSIASGKAYRHHAP